jgi:hypothetical protein
MVSATFLFSAPKGSRESATILMTSGQWDPYLAGRSESPLIDGQKVMKAIRYCRRRTPYSSPSGQEHCPAPEFREVSVSPRP